ncbi:hypothetical protein BC628DRAFT_1410008 [Trametes gibbosa]|nr:hypothetical protein BC628DRAFT_1410008 [Trametes gibbosa]
MSDAAGCRILVISPSASRAHQFVERMHHFHIASSTDTKERVPGATTALAIEPAGSLSPSVSSTRGGSTDPLSAGSSTSIPWTIANKYYTADVHFETHEFEHFRVHHAIGVPAVIYVWGHGEPFKEHIPEIAQKIRHYDPEVSLAVRLTGDGLSASAPTLTEEEDGLDEFISSQGFEFIEGERAYRRPTQDLDRHSDDEDSGIPGLPRVIDALSTIMWPSLVQSQTTRQRKSRARELLGWALEEEADDGLRALIADPAALSTDPSEAIAAVANARKSRMQREMEELERWLEDEETGSGLQYSRAQADGKAPEPPADAEDEKAREWVTSAPVTSVEGWEDMMTPPAIRTPQPGGDGPGHTGTDTEHGFEDDFADFVSATSDSHGLLQPHGFGLGHGEDRLLEVNYDIARLTPMHTGASYRSFASASDFGGDESLYVGREELLGGAYGALLDDEDDPDLPSRAEILETSRRLFGAAAFAPTSDSQSEIQVSTSPASTAIAPHPDSTTILNPIRPSASTLDVDPSADLSLDSEEGDDHSFAAFDLSRVFNALQGMKAEIAGMEDEEERRRAAARVALGLVYGLEAHNNESGHRASSS